MSCCSPARCVPCPSPHRGSAELLDPRRTAARDQPDPTRPGHRQRRQRCAHPPRGVPGLPAPRAVHSNRGAAMTSILQLVVNQTLTGVFLVYTTLMLLHLAIQVTFAELNRRRGLRASYLRPPRGLPSIDVVVPVYHEDPGDLAACCAAIVDQDYAGVVSVFLVDDGSPNLGRPGAGLRGVRLTSPAGTSCASQRRQAGGAGQRGTARVRRPRGHHRLGHPDPPRRHPHDRRGLPGPTDRRGHR